MSHEKYVKKVKEFVDEVCLEQYLRQKKTHSTMKMITSTIGEK